MTYTIELTPEEHITLRELLWNEMLCLGMDEPEEEEEAEFIALRSQDVQNMWRKVAGES